MSRTGFVWKTAIKLLVVIELLLLLGLVAMNAMTAVRDSCVLVSSTVTIARLILSRLTTKTFEHCRCQ